MKRLNIPQSAFKNNLMHDRPDIQLNPWKSFLIISAWYKIHDSYAWYPMHDTRFVLKPDTWCTMHDARYTIHGKKNDVTRLLTNIVHWAIPHLAAFLWTDTSLMEKWDDVAKILSEFSCFFLLFRKQITCKICIFSAFNNWDMGFWSSNFYILNDPVMD